MNILVKKTYMRVTFKALIVIFIITVIGCIYQNAMVSYERGKYEKPGRLIDVYDHKMHTYSEGKGQPTVVFTVGSGTPCAYTDYYFIQKEISKITRTVSYDRLGYGWSEKASANRGINRVVDELHTLLEKSGELPPYILVGHSLSSLEVIRFAQLFPQEVAGIVLIDGGNPSFYADFNENSALMPMYLIKLAGKIGLIRTLGNIGILLPLTDERKRSGLLPEELSKIDKALFFKSSAEKNNIDEVKNINENANTVITGGNIGKIPLIILTSEKSANNKTWARTQQQLKDWSANSNQEMVKKSSHYIHLDNPTLVIERIKELIHSLQ